MASSTIYRQARFLTSSAKLAQCPEDSGQEIAFAGRSNAGKSTTINCLTGNRSLARTSKTPGRTQLINFFDLGNLRRLVDLPGYGYARVPRQVRNAWSRHLDDYLRNRQSLLGLVLVMDARHPLKTFDEMLITWSVDAGIAMHVVLTKSDKLNRSHCNTTLQSVSASLKEMSLSMSVQLFSGTSGQGLQELEEKLDSWFTGGI